MTLNRLLITAVVIENRPVAHVAAQYGVSQSWLFELLARYKTEGEAAFDPRSRRPRTVPTTTPAEVVNLILELREKLTATGLDAGAETIGWHLAHHHGVTVSRATISRYLTKAGLVVPEPKKRTPSPPTSASRPRCPTRPGRPTSNADVGIACPMPTFGLCRRSS